MALLRNDIRHHFTVYEKEPRHLERANTWQKIGGETHLYDQYGRHFSIPTIQLQNLTGMVACGVVLEISGFRNALTQPRTFW